MATMTQEGIGRATSDMPVGDDTTMSTSDVAVSAAAAVFAAVVVVDADVFVAEKQIGKLPGPLGPSELVAMSAR